MVLRGTRKLLALLGVDHVETREPDPDDWYANVLVFDRRKCLLLTHASTLFSVFEPDVRVADLRRTREFVSSLIERELRWEECPPSVFGPLGTEDLLIARTADRSVLGCMNDMAMMCEAAVEQGGGLAHMDNRALNSLLRRNINSSRDYQRPIDLLRARFAQ
jgi:hypothetical protein